MDKLGLFFKALPDKGIVEKTKRARGQKFETTFYNSCFSLKVTEPIGIWKNKSPRYFKKLLDKTRPELTYIKMLIRLCRRCQQIQGKPFLSVKQPDLPMFRVTLEKAFDNVGVDFAGPLLVQERKHGQSSSKAWITLYTCAARGAVHLELVQSLSTYSFIICFRRIISRRGLSCRIYSDNAKTFQSA